MSFNFTDSIDEMLASPMGEVRTAVHAPASYTPKDFSEPCSKCRGSGRYGNFGPCFTCNGKGKKTFKTSPEARAKAIASKSNKKLNSIEAFKAANPEVFEWMQSNTSFAFAVSLNSALHQYGDLTDGQLLAAKKCVATLAAKKAERAAEKAAAIVTAPQVDTAGVDRLKTAFDKAVAYASEKGLTMKAPKITVGGMVISPAKANSTNPGAIYVKSGTTYLGKINGGQFFAARECTDEAKAKVLAFVADPMKAAEAYGQTTGVCCICNATLTSKWKLRGIGPVCATKYGW